MEKASLPGMVFLAGKMFGRQAQLAELEEHLRLVRSGSGRVVFVSGEAGIGKSRLVREFGARVASQQGLQVLKGQCYDESPPAPYALFADALTSYAREYGPGAVAQKAGRWLRDLARLVPHLEFAGTGTGTDAGSNAYASNNPGHTGDPQTEKRHLFEAIYNFTNPADGRNGTILILEDLHCADQTSLELVRYLASAHERNPVLLLATYRSDEIHRRHPLVHLIAQLTRERLLHEIKLQALSSDEVGSMLDAMLHRPTPSAFVDALREHTAGNPLFIEELIRSIMENNRLNAVVDEVQRGKGIHELDVPVSIQDLILRRMSSLDEMTQEVLRYASVIGRGFDFELLSKVTRLEEDQVLRSIELLIGQQLVTEHAKTPEESYSFRHALARDAVYGGLLARDRRLRHRAVLQALEEMRTGGTNCADSVIDQLAYHSLKAGNLQKAGYYARQAGEKAAAVHAYREAIAHFEVALDLSIVEEPREKAELYDKLGRAAYLLGDSSLCGRYWSESQRLYQQLGDNIKVGYLHSWLSEVTWYGGDTESAFSHAQAAIEVLEAEPPGHELALAYVMLSLLYLMKSSRPQDAASWGERALHLATELNDEVVQVRAMNYLGRAFVLLGEKECGISYLQRNLVRARREDVSTDMLWVYFNYAGSLILLGELKEAAELLNEGIEISSRAGFDFLKGILTLTLGEVQIELGSWDEARTLLDRAVRAGEMGPAIWRLYTAPARAELLYRQGRAAAAGRLLEELLPEYEAQAEIQMLRRVLPTLLRVRLALGDVDGAMSAVQRYEHLRQELGVLVGDEKMLCYGVEACYRAGKAKEVRLLLEALTDLNSKANTPSTQAHLQEALGLQASQERRHDRAAEHFTQATAIWAELGLRYNEAISRTRYAESLIRSGTPMGHRRAESELSQAQNTFVALGALRDLEALDAMSKKHHLRLEAAPRTSAQSMQGETLVRTLYGRDAGGGKATSPSQTESLVEALSERELEVLRLIAAGMPNQQIAEQLIITLGTVKSHVSHIYSKLGVASRTQALARARELALI